MTPATGEQARPSLIGGIIEQLVPAFAASRPDSSLIQNFAKERALQNVPEVAPPATGSREKAADGSTLRAKGNQPPDAPMPAPAPVPIPGPAPAPDAKPEPVVRAPIPEPAPEPAPDSNPKPEAPEQTPETKPEPAPETEAPEEDAAESDAANGDL